MLTYQVVNSENHISALVTDDFYGMLDDNESITGSDLLDIGIGRILASDVIMAKQQVDKIEHYIIIRVQAKSFSSCREYSAY